jgi:hypothetical protein
VEDRDVMPTREFEYCSKEKIEERRLTVGVVAAL